MVVIRWLVRRLLNSRVRKYRTVSRLVALVAVVKWCAGRRPSVRRVTLRPGETLVMGITKEDTVSGMPASRDRRAGAR